MAVPPQERHSTRNVSKSVLGKHPRLRIPPDAGGLRIPHYGVMREEDVIFMSCPSFPHPNCPSSSDFPSFPVINITSVPSHENASIVTKPDPSCMSPLKSSAVATQDCPSSMQLSSSMSPLKIPSQTECSSTPCSSRSQDSCSPQLLENQSSINDYADFKLFPTYTSKSQTEYSPSLPLNGTSTFHTLSHSLAPMNCYSTTDLLSFSSTSPLKCSCQPESSTTSCQNPIAISQMMYSSISTQSCKSISKQTQSECSSIPQINRASTSRTNGQSVSPLDSSSCYFTPPTEDPSDFSPIYISDSSKLSVHVWSSTSVLSCQPGNQDVKSLSDDCSPVDIPCVCTCEFSTDLLPEISSSHLTYHPCSPVKNDNHVSSSVDYASLNHFGASSLSPHEIPYILQTKDYSELSNNITPANGIIPPHMNTTTDPRGTFTSTKCNSTNIDPLTPWFTQSFQSSTSPEINVVSINDQLSNDHLPVDGQYVHTCSCSLPNSADSLTNSKVLNSPSFSTNTPPTPNFICPNSTNQTVSTSTHERHPKMLSSCPHIFSSEATPKYLPFSEEENRVQECEVCKASLENKVRMDQDRQLCENLLDSLSRFEDWLQIAQITTYQGNPYKTLHQDVKLALRKYEVLLTDMREKLLDLESLNRQYWRLAQTAQPMLLPSVLRSRMQEVNALWDSLQGEAETLHRTLKSQVQQREEFETDQDDMKLCLTEMDLELSNVEYIYGGNSTEKIQQLKAFQEDVWSNMKKVEGLLERGDQLIDSSDPRDAADLEVEMTELGSYCQQIYIRLSRLQKRLVSTKLVFEDDFLDGAIENLSSGSSDVFLDLDLEDGEVSSLVNDPSTSEVLPVDLEWDPLGDVGRSSSHDGQESFYTATSAPWKLPQTSEGSRSSLSSYSGITYSNMRRQQVKEPLDDIDDNHTRQLDNCHLEWIEEQTHGQGWMESASALHSSRLHSETAMPQGINSCSGECPTGMKFSLPTDQADSELRTDNHFALPGYSWKTESPLISHVAMTDGRSQPNCSGQRRRPRKKKRAAKNLDTKGTLKPTKPDVSILMENGDDLSHLGLHKTSYKPSCSLCVWIRRLVFASILFLVLVTSFLFPWGHQSCLSKSFSWSLMLTYVNGPPPT